jgi:flagellar biosynthesis/type III secretory pathway M-ring protein FliF/YscJ
MDSATILVLVLCAGVVALLIWFEINSRRNEARKKAESADAEMLFARSRTTVEPKGDKKKAA